MRRKAMNLFRNKSNYLRVPPSQDSPKNIVNILDDDCIRMILLKLDDAVDVWNAAQVCTRFRKISETSSRIKHIQFGYNNVLKDVVSFDSAEDFLSLFGPRIESICCDFGSHSKNVGEADNEKNFNLILKYCGQTLIKLKIVGDGTTLHLVSPFEALTKLTLFRIYFMKFDRLLMLPKLEIISRGDLPSPCKQHGSRRCMIGWSRDVYFGWIRVDKVDKLQKLTKPFSVLGSKIMKLSRNIADHFSSNRQ